MVRVKEWLLVLFSKVKCSITLSYMMSCYHRDVGVKAIENLMKKKGRKFDYVLLETTGLADPGEYYIKIM